MNKKNTVWMFLVLAVVTVIGTPFFTAAGSILSAKQAPLALELLTGMPGNILDPDVPVVLTVNLFSPLASAIYEKNLDREEDTETQEIPEISIQFDGKNWWEVLSLQSQEGEAEKEIPFQILDEPSQTALLLGEGEVSSCRIAIQQGVLSEKAVLSVLIERDEGTIRSEKVEVRFKAETLSQVQKLEAWIPYYLALENTNEARSKADELIKLIPQASSPYSYMAQVLEADGDLEGAKENILKAIELYGEHIAGEDPPFLYLEQLKRIQEKIEAKKKSD
jgi:hypothetical protein